MLYDLVQSQVTGRGAPSWYSKVNQVSQAGLVTEEELGTMHQQALSAAMQHAEAEGDGRWAFDLEDQEGQEEEEDGRHLNEQPAGECTVWFERT